MLPPQLRKFTDLYENYGLGAVKNIWLLTCLIPLARTVNLNKLKDYVSGVLKNEATDPASHYKRLTRFFQDWGERIELLEDLLRYNVRLLRKLGFKRLILDGTSWTIGKTDVHYLVLSILVGPVAVPIYWVQLEKIGASNQAERKALFEKALALFNLEGMTLLADREYIGKEWFTYLKRQRIDFVIRLRVGDYAEDVDGDKPGRYEQLYTRCGCKDRLGSRKIRLQGVSFLLVVMSNPKADAQEPVFIFLTTLASARKAADLYVKRWKIEGLFRHLKSNGYNLEDLNLKDPGKNRLLLALVALAYTLVIGQGLQRQKRIASNRYRNGSTWPETSIFREGLAVFTTICFDFLRFIRHVLASLRPQNHPFCKNVQ